MQTYTHLIVGALLGKMLFPESVIGQVACATCSIIPDLVMVPKFISDKIAGKKPLEEQSDLLISLKESSHSLIIWGLVGLIGVLVPSLSLKIILYASSLGGTSHVLLDILTHKEERYRKHEASYLWPLPGSLQGLAIYEYRIDNGVLRPKFPELVTITIASLCYIALWFI